MKTSSEPPMTGEQLLAILTEQIVSGAFTPGERLPSERNLAATYGSSRTMVREALGAIEAQGLLTIRPGMGAFVADSTVSSPSSHVDVVLSRANATAAHVATARTMLDVETGRLAALEATDEDLKSVLVALERFEAATNSVALAVADVAFHEAVTAASHNPVLQHMFASIKQYLQPLVLHSAATATVQEHSRPLHRQLYEAIKSRDPDLAQKVAHEHGSIALDLYGADLDVPLSELRH